MAKEGNVVYKDAKVKCACGSEWTTKSTKDEIHVEVCSECHPFYTGKQTIASKAGAVERFNAKYGINQNKAKKTEE